MERSTRKGTVRQKISPVPLARVKIQDVFWKPRMETNRKVTLAHEYQLNKKNGVLTAYQWDWWNPAKGNPPWRIWVGDVPKWLEAVSYSLATHPDARLAALAERVVQGVIKGQKKDGYLYANPLPRDWRWTNLQEKHELYDAGHAMEGAVAYYQATGRRNFLDAMCRYADLLDVTFGREKGKMRGYDGHPEVELALVKLYRATGEKRYLKLAKFFVDERGRKPYYFDLERKALSKRGLATFNWFTPGNYVNCQAHKPLRRQEDAVGHSVRALYLYSGAADVAVETGDAELMQACRRLWKSVTRRRMYVIGGAGSTAHGEAFTFDHDLPNETAYAETCANIALVFFAHRMLQTEAQSEYADVMERALYNGVLSGVSLDGKRFFYANHLTVAPQALDGAHGHIAAARQGWFGCACCPPNIARLIASIGQYVCSTSRDGLYVHLYVAGSAQCEVAGRKVAVTQDTRYPWKETVKLTLKPKSPMRFTVALRIPGWCRRAAVKVNGRAVGIARTMKNGYACIRRVWERGDRIELTLPMPVERVEAHPSVRMDCGKVALQRGPVVYCLEEVDNGRALADIFLPRSSKLRAEYKPRLLGGAVVIRGNARRRATAGWDNRLYRADRSATKTVDIKAVPYCVWANRKPGEMIVWMRGD